MSGLVWSCSSNRDVSTPKCGCTKEVLCAWVQKVLLNSVSYHSPLVLLQQDGRSSARWKITDAFLLGQFEQGKFRLVHYAQQHENLEMERPHRCFHHAV